MAEGRMRGGRNCICNGGRRDCKLEDENCKLKQLVVELSLNNRALEYFLSKKP